MPLRDSLFDGSAIYAKLAEFYQSIATVKTRETADTYTPTTYGEPASPWTALPGHEGIACMLSRGPGDREQKEASRTVATAGGVVMLAGYYPAIQPQMVVEVDGVTFDIVAINSDSTKQQTELIVQEVTS